ncbi:fasciclin domain-containing protein [Streptacidiphilus jiangxiensis]|uniref:Uncaracterized surface protein containing fasciclin (FAS1) repeats n=1 Tax=Streptacidiphilus jiangxiensis TaxID=235985 RepID=A0A1H7N2N8_STRJI|nr:fasciclin domain-containing protein [Streptacidiphilus jiangxiensis]SEL17589.1 Uncaracterized surface protein containing fasciclin (FAS1) repeats [Streptacidiphilus jiangxiensis]
MAVTSKATALAAAAAAGILAVTLSACSSGSSTSNAVNAPASSAATSSGTMSGAAMAEPFGAACSAVPSSGPGSFSGMAQDPVATAASHNPALSTLVTAVEKAGLTDTLNSAKDITVFAPANAAFAKIPTATLDSVLNNKAELTKILTYHVVPGQLSPSQLAGTHKTLEGSDLTVTGSGEQFTVNGTSMVVCGDVHTANATVYIVDTVLMPKS